jgi:hypothetical protein
MSMSRFCVAVGLALPRSVAVIMVVIAALLVNGCASPEVRSDLRDSEPHELIASADRQPSRSTWGDQPPLKRTIIITTLTTVVLVGGLFVFAYAIGHGPITNWS